MNRSVAELEGALLRIGRRMGELQQRCVDEGWAEMDPAPPESSATYAEMQQLAAEANAVRDEGLERFGVELLPTRPAKLAEMVARADALDAELDELDERINRDEVPATEVAQVFARMAQIVAEHAALLARMEGIAERLEPTVRRTTSEFVH